MNFEQVKGILERIIYPLVMLAVAKKWIPEGIAQDVTIAIVTLIGVVWGWKVNTKPALDEAAKAVKK